MHIPGCSEFIATCLLRLVLLKLLPANVLVIEASAVGAPQARQLPSCIDSCISADTIRAHAISLYITAIDYQLLLSLDYNCRISY